MNSVLRDDAPLAYRLVGTHEHAGRLLVLAHGVGGNESNLAALAAQAPADTAVLLPRAPLTVAPGQYAWFPVAFTAQGPQPDLEAAEASRVRLADFIAAMQTRLAVAPSSTVVAGFSQGGIMSASVALTCPQLVGGFGVLAGRILPELEPRIAPPHALAPLRAFIGHGRHDTKLPVDWAHRSTAWLTRLGVEHEARLYDGDHGVPPAMASDFIAWFDRVLPGVRRRGVTPG